MTDLTTEPAIDIFGLYHWFSDDEFSPGWAKSKPPHVTLRDINFVLPAGKIAVLAGPSGCGKTTLLTLIGGLRRVREGSARVLGRQLNGMSDRELVAVRRNVGFIFQAHNLFESLTAYQNVQMATDLTRMSRREVHDRITELLVQLDLGHRIHYKPGDMSGGQRQRVAVARALANRPRLILADEPTAALDKKSGGDVLRLLRQAADEDGTAVLIVTHDKRVLDQADRIVNLSFGDVVSDVEVQEQLAIVRVLSELKTQDGERLFAGTVDELNQIAEQMRRVTFPAGREVFAQGAHGEDFFVIRSGQAQVRAHPSGQPQEIADPQIDPNDPTKQAKVDYGQTVATLGAGDFFGEMALMKPEGENHRSASILAAGEEPLVTYTLNRANFHKAMRLSESFDMQVRSSLLARQ